ncbi:MAG TPA: nucleotidyl transferase AbiEii/AbiGii toxin family protein [Chitinophagaceae bacterium]|nr:nucleotidyl transferase AbiEii/AbiGii toxin family protein [Chitinophagaceae bacterium]
MSHQQHIARIKAVYTALEELGPEVVFVGGATVSLYADRPAGEARPTEDVDILIELLNYSGYAAVEEKLRSKGFSNDIESGVICRYRINGIVVDVMPTHEAILGFANRWYPDGFASAFPANLGEGYQIRLFRPEYFLASKLEAFLDRGNGDGRMSTDFEDIVYLLNNRVAIWEEINAAAPDLKIWLQEQFLTLLRNGYLYEWVSAHLDHSEQRRTSLIVSGLEEFVSSTGQSEGESRIL